MLHAIYQNNKNHIALVLITLLSSFILSLIAIFASILQHIVYLSFLPISFMLFMAALFGILILSDEEINTKKNKIFFSIEASTILFSILLIPLAIYFVTSGDFIR